MAFPPLWAAAVAMACVIGCGGRPPEAATAPTTAPFGAGRLWDDGRAEIDAYEAAVRRDGLPRKFTAYLIVVKEDLSRKSLAKADPGHDPADLVTVLKLNHVLDYRTGISSCRQTATCYFDRDSMELLKLSLASSDWSGSTYKEFQRRDGGGLLRVHTDRDDPAEASYDVPIGPDVVFYDQLPLWIRSLPQAVGTRRELRLLPTQIDPHAPRPEIRKGTLQAVRQEILLVKAGGVQVTVIESQFARKRLQWTVDSKRRERAGARSWRAESAWSRDAGKGRTRARAAVPSRRTVGARTTSSSPRARPRAAKRWRVFSIVTGAPSGA